MSISIKVLNCLRLIGADVGAIADATTDIVVNVGVVWGSGAGGD